MKKFLQRTAASALAGGLLLSCAAAGAGADTVAELPYVFEQARCASFEAERADNLRDAWHLQRLKMDDVWPLATGKGVKVAVIDTGVSVLGSPYFDRGRVEGLDFIGHSEDELEKKVKVDCLHGTFVTSLLAAGRRDDGPVHQATNFAGIAPDAQILFYRTLSQSVRQVKEGEQAPPPDSLLPAVNAVDQAVADGAQIINLSWTVPSSVPYFAEFEAAIQRALAAEVIVVAAAGNSLGGGSLFPASFPGVISVGMSAPGDSPDPESHASPNVTVGAPGVDMLALAPSTPEQGTVTSANQAFHTGKGTSYAAPIVSGVLALMIEFDARVNRPPLTPAAAAERLAATADPPPASAPDRQLGYGIVNPLRALMDIRPAAESTGEGQEQEPTEEPTPEPEAADLGVPALGLGIAVGSVVLVSLGVVAAIAIPAARRAG